MNTKLPSHRHTLLILLTVGTLAGCAPSRILTVQRPGPNDPPVGAHLSPGQKLMITGPRGRDEHYVVLAVEDDDPSTPAHGWRIEPYRATKQSENEYVLTAIVPNIPHNPGQEAHTIRMTVTPDEFIFAADAHPAGGGDHDGIAHLR